MIFCGLYSCSNDVLNNNSNQRDDSKKISDYFTDITCPHCGFTANEKLPEETCLIKYDCLNCNRSIYPKDGDCCVFCSYGTHKCPSIQNDE